MPGVRATFWFLDGGRLELRVVGPSGLDLGHRLGVRPGVFAYAHTILPGSRLVNVDHNDREGEERVERWRFEAL